MKRGLLLIAVVAIALSSCKKPTVAFTASSASVLVGEVVTFTDASEDAYHYVWDFGDGTESSTAKNPTHTYWATGDYIVTLKIAGKNMKNVSEATTTITVSLSELDQHIADLEEERKQTDHTQNHNDYDMAQRALARSEIVESILGKWDWDKYTYDLYETEDGKETKTTSVLDSHSSPASFEFIEEGQILVTDDEGNQWTESWFIIDDDRMNYFGVAAGSGVYDIEELDDDDFEFTRTLISPGFAPIESQRRVWRYELSK